MIPVISANKRTLKGLTYNFSQSDGALSGFDYTNSAWTVASNKALSTPTLGAELFVNGAFAADTNWTKGTGWTIGSGAATHASGTASNISQNVGTVGDWYRVGFDITAAATSWTTAVFGATSNLGSLQYTTPQSVVSIGRQITGASLGIRANTTTVSTVDNATGKKITLSDMFASISGFQLSARISAGVTIPTQDAPCGVVGWLDSHTSPANFIICTHNGTNLRLTKCVAGVYTDLISTAATYSAGAEVSVRGLISGSDLLLTAYYNGVQISTQQTVSDAGIVSNTRHGMFSASETNTISRFTVR